MPNPKVLFQLSDGTPDPRSNVVDYQVTITNQGDLPIYLQEISPIYSRGVTYEDALDSLGKLEAKRKSTCEELSQLLDELHRLHRDDGLNDSDRLRGYWKELVGVLKSPPSRLLGYY